MRNRVYNDVKKNNDFNNYRQSNNESIDEDKNHEEKSESSHGSQNFRLHVTDSLLTDDSPEKDSVVKYNKKPNERLKKSDVIIISDSSDEDSSSSYLRKKNDDNKNESSRKSSTDDDGKSKKLQNNYYKKSISLDTTDEDEDYVNAGSLINSKSRTLKKVRDKNRISLLTSDESLTETRKNNVRALISDTLTSPRIPVFNSFKKYQSNTRSIKSRERKKNQFDASNSSSSGGGKTKNVYHSSSSSDDSPSLKISTPRTLKKFQSNNRIDKEKKQLNTPNKLKLSECTTPLSKKDVNNIKKTIDSRRVVFDSPSNWNKNTIIDETESESDESESNFNKRKNILHPALINNTLSDEESPKSTPDYNIPREPSVVLSESKKNQISNWLMNAPDDARSDDSLSIVPPSTSSPAGSGNSSLERLEVNYETPNNRDKFRKNFNYIESPLTTRPTSKISTIDLSKKKAVPPEKKNYSPLSVIKPRHVVNTIKSLTKEAKRITDINNYDDILEKLYGNDWKAMIVKKSTTPHNDKNLNVRNTGVQTEPKRKLFNTEKKAISISSTSSDDDNPFASPTDKGRYLKIKKKPVTVIRKPCKDSFIDDSIVGSGGDTTYLTALTTPQISDESNSKKNQTPKSATTRRAIEICDSDSEDDKSTIKNKNNDGNNLENKKRLSYSDDDNTSTGTSEYDPLDVVLPRRIFKTTTTPRVKPQKLRQKWPTFVDKSPLKTKSFLASLAGSVPMEESHSDAKKYKLDFKNKKEELSKKLYKLYNENVFNNRLPGDMSIEWNIRMRGTAGYCYNRKTTRTIGGITRSSRIVLSSKILDSADRLRDTLIHEMCHAASWLLNEVCDGHGPFWKAWASKAVKTFPELPPIKRCHDYKISTKFTYRCLTCGYR